jgi:ethanolamine utilization protein EutA (predicted chaperonin)
MPNTAVYEYLTAVLDLAIPPAGGNLRVLRAGEIITTASIAIGGR